MNLSKQHRILIGVCAIGAAAVITDRLTREDSGPAEASAAALSPLAAHAPAAGKPARSAAKPEPAFDEQRSLARRIMRVAEEQKLGEATVDAFAVSEPWMELVNPSKAVEPSEPKAAAAREDLRAAFAKAHRLSALLQGGPMGGVAMVDGKPVRLGESVEGLRLVRLGPRSAVFSGSGVEVELRLPELMPDNPGRPR